jgi:hypothetical protein
MKKVRLLPYEQNSRSNLNHLLSTPWSSEEVIEEMFKFMQTACSLILKFANIVIFDKTQRAVWICPFNKIYQFSC